ncbi:MAG: DUF45 domain-containing protein [Candidatus Omnitrophica bacterium]|nr:DUF45 domain-containing protein [Candidatus Omnitrophota bacterium]
MIIEIEGIGPVLFEKSKFSRKNLTISIKPSNPVKVLMPKGLSLKQARNFLRQKISWINKSLDRLDFLKEKHKSTLQDISSLNHNQQKLKLIKKTHELAKKYRFSYKSVSIRNQKTRWGSCSKDNKINLNIKLLRLPEDLIDYVIVHELLHTRIKNHSKIFKAELDKLTGNRRRGLNSRLKSYHIGFIE